MMETETVSETLDIITVLLYLVDIYVGTDRKENTAALLLPSLQALQFQYIILILYNLDDYNINSTFTR
jgi:hypothetical protein